MRTAASVIGYLQEKENVGLEKLRTDNQGDFLIP